MALPQRTEHPHRGTTLQRRLILFLACATIFLILAFTLLLLLFGINGRGEKAVHGYLTGELAHVTQAVYDDLGHLSLDGIRLAETLSASCDNFFAARQIDAGSLPAHPELLEPLLAEQLQTLLLTLDSRTCGGVFVLLDATVRPEAEGAEYARAGIFLKKTLPTDAQAVSAKTHYLRGPARIARESGIQLLGQWSMEFDVTNQPFFGEVMAVARENGKLPLSRLYRWTGRVTLKGNSEAGFLLCVPLRAGDGAVFGLCGIEVSDRMFKQLYCPAQGAYPSAFALAAPAAGQTLLASRGMIAGNYYLTGNRMTEDLTLIGSDAALMRYTGGGSVYGGVSGDLRLYPTGSPYESESWAVSVLMPEAALTRAERGNSAYLPVIALVLLAAGLGLSVLLSRRYPRPVTRALDSIRASDYREGEDSDLLEIADLIDFLSEKDREQARQRRALEQAQRNARRELDRMAAQRRRETDPEGYQHFLSQLERLTPRERQVFDLYLEGRTGREIPALLGFSENALKYHNKNIYEKLGVFSRKELLLYAQLMREQSVPGPS